MANPSASGNFEHHTQLFLQQHPGLSDSLFEDCDQDPEKVTKIIEPVLTASQRCQVGTFYIQIVATGRTIFLTTNMGKSQTPLVLSAASSWLIGRSPSCDISASDAGLSRRHAVIGQSPEQGFYLTDLGSTNGSQVNRRRLKPLERRPLNDGDLIEFGYTKVEFFIVRHAQSDCSTERSDSGNSEATYF